MTLTLGGAGFSPQFFACPALIPDRDRLFLARRAMSGGGCIYTSHFVDWLVFDAAGAEVTASGSGDFIGGAGKTGFLLNPDESVTVVRQGKLFSSGAPGISNSALSTFSVQDSKHVRHDRGLVFGQKNDRPVAAVLDDRGHEIVCFPATMNDWHTGWVVLDSGVLKYSKSWNSEIAPAQTTNNPLALLQLFDFKARLVSHRQLRMTKGDAWSLECIGVTRGGTPIFYSEPHLFSLRLPGLEPCFVRVERSSAQSEDTFHTDANSELVFHVSGNATLYKMHTPSEARIIVVRAIDTKSGIVKWIYKEPVVIRKKNYERR
jgi:hypothetical protein